MEPIQQQEPKLDYASVVKRAALSSAGDNESSVAKESQLTVEALTQSVQTPHPAMSAEAKPYIPSYLAALKSNSAPVMLEGVPVNNRRKPLTEAMGSSTVSNSCMEPESTASWVDDDENFLLAVARSQQAMRVSHMPPSQGGGGGVRPAERDSDSGRGSSRATNRRGGKGGNSRKKGWRTVPGEPTMTGGNHHPRRDRRRGNNQSNGNNSNNIRTGDGGSAVNVVSGGRFDVLSNNKVMRHL